MQHTPPAPPPPPPPPPQLWDFGLAYTYWIKDKSNWNTPRKKNPVSLNARVFQSPIYNHISTPSPLFQCCNHVTVHGAYCNIEMGEREVWQSTKKFILLKCVNTLSDCSLLWRPRSCPHYDGGKLRPFPGKHIKYFLSTLLGINVKTQRRSFWVCMRKTGKSFRKAPFPKCFLSVLKRKAGLFKFLHFRERFRDGLV